MVSFKKKTKPTKVKTKPNIKGKGKLRDISKGKFILMVGDDGAVMLLMQGNNVIKRLFSPSSEPTHVKPLLDILSANPKLPIYMLVDTIDQSYIKHTLPPVSPMSVGGLVKRRLKKDFAKEDMKGALSLGREKTGKREWNYLLVGVPTSGIVGEWLDLIMELNNHFKGVFLAPVEGENYIQAIIKAIGIEKKKVKIYTI